VTTPAVHVIVFSKDRPLQLHGYLTSLFEHWSGAYWVDVLVRRRGPYEAAYAEVEAEFSGRTSFWDEESFGGDLDAIIPTSDATPLTCFGCDDAVFVAPVDTALLLPLFEAAPKLLGISLRLGQTVRRGMWGHAMAQPRFLAGMHEFQSCPVYPAPACVLEWDCTATGSAGDWAYPWDVVGTVYRTDFVRRMVAALAAEGFATNPSTLEHYGAQRWPQHAEGTTLLRAWHRPRLVLPTVNVVQSEFPNGVVGGGGLDPAFLLECWGRGLRLDPFRYAAAPPADSWRTGDLFLRRAP
jgi:hypothetical protein